MFDKAIKAFDQSFRFSKQKILITNIFLVIAFLLFLFFHSFNTDSLWMQTAYFFVPVLFSFTLLFCLGIFLSDIDKLEKFNGKRIWISSSEKLKKSIYLPFIPLLLFLGIWVLLGIFYLLQTIPVLDTIFDVLLIFIPFILLFLASSFIIYELLLLFFILPTIEAKKRNSVRKVFVEIRKKPFQSLLLLIISLLPITVFFLIVLLATTFMPINSCGCLLFQSIRALFYSLPILFLSSFFIVSFFQFSSKMANLEDK